MTSEILKLSILKVIMALSRLLYYILSGPNFITRAETLLQKSYLNSQPPSEWRSGGVTVFYSLHNSNIVCLNIIVSARLL